MNEQSWWGCESLDLESYVNPTYKQKYSLPMWLLEKCVDQVYIQNIINKDSRYIHDLAEDIRINGILQPVKLTIGLNGVTLSDGNHRYAAARMLQLERLPTAIKISSHRIKQGGIETNSLITLLLENLYE